MANVEDSPVEECKVEPKVTGLKRKRAAEKPAVNLEALAAKIKRLQGEADQAAAKAAEFQAEAVAKRAEASKASHEYTRKQREAALAHLESSCPKRPSNPFFLFSADVKLSGDASICDSIRSRDKNKKLAEMWVQLSDQEKQKYRDGFELENKKYLAWTVSEEGRKILGERSEALRQCGAAARAAAATASELQQDDEGAAAVMKNTSAASALLETPVKQRRVKLVRKRCSTEPVLDLDEKVLEEAGRADMLEQLRNLAGRPEVLALEKSSQELLDALKANAGMVNAAKRSLLVA